MSEPRVIFCVQRDLMLPAHTALAARHPTLLVRDPGQLERALAEDVRPRWVVLSDWSWLVPERLLARAEFIGFHAADLPAYRGGSPLHHQIMDGITTTKLSCIRIAKGVDSGDILVQADLSLAGTIGEIWNRIAALIPSLVERVLTGDFTERPQGPGGFVRKRRKPEESRITDPGMPMDRLYDFMRMLDEPYPNAFLTLGGKRWSFRKVRRENGEIVAEVVVRTEEGLHD